MSDRPTILPSTYTPLVKAFDRIEERLYELPVAMITKSPHTIPIEYLDHLAWENSVDVWDVEWPEDIKRAVVDMAEEVHRYKGTPWAIRRALSSLEIRSDLREWWQAGVNGERGTYEVTAYITQALYEGEPVLIPPRLVAAILALVERVGPVSRGVTVRWGVGLRPAPVLMSGAFYGLSRAGVAMTAKTPSMAMDAIYRPASGAVAITKGCANLRMVPPKMEAQAGLFVRSGAILRDRLRIDFRSTA